MIEVTGQRVVKAFKPGATRPLSHKAMGQVAEWMDQGLIGTGGLGGEMKMWATHMDRVLAGKGLGRGPLSVLKKGIDAPMEAAGGIYLASDEWAKVLAYEAKKKTLNTWYKAAEKGKHVSDFNKYMADIYGYSSKAFIKDAAGDFAKQTVQHFPYTAEIAKQLSMNPFVAPFASFYAEMPLRIVLCRDATHSVYDRHVRGQRVEVGSTESQVTDGNEGGGISRTEARRDVRCCQYV
jgi:hypothetical protein